MHENKFERQVREKMDELGFAPSEAVWAGVDREINKDRKRRRPIFWLFIFLGLFLAAGGYYFGSDNKSPGNRRTENTQIPKDIPQGGHSANLDQVKKGDQRENRSGESSDREKTRISSKMATKNISGQQPQGSKPEQKETAIIDDEVPVENKDQETGMEKNEAGEINMDSSLVKKPTPVSDAKPAIKDTVPGLTPEFTQKKKSNSASWKIGFNGNAGFSSTGQGLFQSSSYQTAAPVYGSPSPGTNGGGNTGYSGNSETKAGFSFGIGAFVNRHFSERISLSAGLDYHYYSTKLNTGVLVDSTISVNATYGSLSSVRSYYRNGTEYSYTNQYHFIELPVTVNFQLNKNKLTPVIWEAGVSLSYLISNNALHYDGLNNVYFQNNQLLNKTQFSLATAIMFGFRLNHDEWQVGPQLQYGLTSLLNTGAGDSQHLFYGGLKISFIPGIK